MPDPYFHLDAFPRSQHWLDWFHLTMQLTNLRQSPKGLARLDA
jgi:hypothetical protein